MKRLQTFHETLIPMLVAACGAENYLELGTHQNETISKVVCLKRYGVDLQPMPCAGARMFTMSTRDFLVGYASKYGPFDFVFIDADHSADASWSDFELVWPHVAQDGMVAMHDVNPQWKEDTSVGLCGDSWKTAMKICTSGYEAVVLNYHPGLLLVRKRFKWEPEREEKQITHEPPAC